VTPEGANRVVLTARIAERSALRYTPAGLPALDLRLEHESLVEEAGESRQVKASLKTIALGTLADRLDRQPLDITLRFLGFLATPRNSKGVVFHLQEFQHIS
jgi:primosomal replication protein N